MAKVMKSGIVTWGLFIVIWWILSLFQSEVLLPGPLETLKGAKELILNGKLLTFALITLFLMWFGVGETSKIVLITYGTVFVVIVNIISGILALDKDRINSARDLGVSEFQILLTVIWPSVIPYAFTGARLGLGGAFASIVAAEMLSSKEEIGYLIFTARMYFHTDWIITGVIVLGILGYLSDKLLRLIGNNLLARYGVREKKAF